MFVVGLTVISSRGKCLDGHNSAMNVSYRVNKCPFLVLEHQHTDQTQQRNADNAIGQTSPRELPYPESSILECLNDGSQRIQAHHLIERRILDGAQRIDHWRGVHPKRHEHWEEVPEILILSGHRRDDEPQAKGGRSKQHHKHWEKQQIPVRMDVDADECIDHIDCHEEGHLNGEPEQIGEELREGRYEAGVIHLAEDGTIGLECGGYLVDALGKIVPKTDARQIEQRLRDSIGRNLRNPREYDNVDKRREQRGDEVPTHAEDGLLELDGDVALHEQPQQIFLVPDLLQVQMPEGLMRLDFGYNHKG